MTMDEILAAATAEDRERWYGQCYSQRARLSE